MVDNRVHLFLCPLIIMNKERYGGAKQLAN